MISGGGKDDSDLARRLAGLAGEALVKEIEDFVRATVSELLKTELSADDANMPMSEAGLDSLSSFELKMRLESELGITIMVSHFLKAPTIAELSKVLAHAFETERDKAATAESASERDGGPTGTQSVVMRSFADAQSALVAASVARFTSATARRALEHRATIELPEGTTGADIQQAIYAVFEEHPLIGLTCDLPSGDVPILAMGEAPRLSNTVLTEDDVLDVNQGVLLRIGREGDVLQIVMHRAVGDEQSLSTLTDALRAALAEEDLSQPVLSASEHLTAITYQPELPQGLRDFSFWDHALRSVPGPIIFDNRGRALGPEAMGLDHGPAVCVEGEIKGSATQAQVLLSFAHALRRLSGDAADVIIACDVDSRPEEGRGLIGPFTVTVPLVVPVVPNEDWQFVDFERLIAAVPDHLSFDLYAARQELADRFDPTGARPGQVGFRWVQGPLPEEPAGALNDIRLEVIDDGTGLAYRMIFDADVISEEDRAEIVEFFLSDLSERCRESGERTSENAETVG